MLRVRVGVPETFAIKITWDIECQELSGHQSLTFEFIQVSDVIFM